MFVTKLTKSERWATIRWPIFVNPDLLVLFILSGLVISPVLLFPHWGLFSDADQILTLPRRLLNGDSNSSVFLRPLSDGRWNPLFHLLTTLIYAIFGPSPRAFYLVQWGMLALALGLVFSLSYRLANGSRAAAWGAALLVLLGGLLAENFLTLDKVEPRVGLFAAAAVAWFATTLLKYDHQSPSAGQMGLFLGGQFLLAVVSIFSKETGVFLLPVAGLALLLTLLQARRRPGWILLAAGLLTAQATAFLLFRLLFNLLANPEIVTYRYVAYTPSFDQVVQNLRFYLRHMPELILAMLVFLGWSLGQAITGQIRRWAGRDLALCTVGLAGCAYGGGILLWRSPGGYLMYPAALFLAISLAVLAGRYVQTSTWPHLARARLWLALLPAALLLPVYLPQRLYTAQATYAQDEAKDLLVQALTPRITAPPARLAVLQFHPDSIELGERVEFFISREQPAYPVEVFNMIEGPWLDRADLHRYDQSVGLPPSPQQLERAANRPEPYLLWRFGRITTDPPELAAEDWFFSTLQPGDWLLIPVGSPRNRETTSRGVSMYSVDSAYWLRQAPQVKWKQVAAVHLPIGLSGVDFLGWEVFELLP